MEFLSDIISVFLITASTITGFVSCCEKDKISSELPGVKYWLLIVQFIGYTQVSLGLLNDSRGMRIFRRQPRQLIYIGLPV